jgi:hypothetical protein
MLPMWEGLVATNHLDAECSELADRHYSRRTVGARQFLYSGRKLVLRDAAGLVLFGWVWPDESMRMDNQKGYNCAIFRNESTRRASDIILEAEAMAFAKWGPNRIYTYVDGGKIKSVNPGYCFKKAGWARIGASKSGLTLLAKEMDRPTCHERAAHSLKGESPARRLPK